MSRLRCRPSCCTYGCSVAKTPRPQVANQQPPRCPVGAAPVVDQYDGGRAMVGKKACEAAKTSCAAVVPEHRARAADTAHPAQANRPPGSLVVGRLAVHVGQCDAQYGRAEVGIADARLTRGPAQPCPAQPIQQERRADRRVQILATAWRPPRAPADRGVVASAAGPRCAAPAAPR
jgi:hypothetical protein